MKFFDVLAWVTIGYIAAQFFKFADERVEEDLARIEEYANYEWDKG